MGVETMGGYCGYLATMAGMGGGADAAYINEEKFGIKDLTRDMDILISKMEHGQVFRGLMIVNEKANPHYNIDFIRRMYTEEGRSHFTVRDNVLGHSQQGGIPSSFDRNMSTFSFRPVQQLAKETDFEKRISVNQGWWMKLRQINDVLAKHDSIYEKEALDPDTF